MIIISNLAKKLLIFDLDGTIIDFKEAQYLATEKVFSNKSEEFSFELGKNNELHGFKIGAELLGISFDEMKLWDETFLQYLETYSTIHDSIPVLLENLTSKGVFCSINTNRNKTLEEIKSILQKYSIDQFFSSVQTLQTTGIAKPDPKGVEIILSELKVSHENCYFVGDSIVDIMTGKNAGVKTIAISSGFFNKSDFIQYLPDFIISDLIQIIDIIQ